MKKRIFLVFIVFLGLFFLFFVSNKALAREWELDWPDLPGIVSPTKIPEDQLTLAYFITYIFTFALLIVGIVALLMLIISAIRYMASTTMPTGKTAAMEQMRNVGYGVLLLLGAYIILSTINPELVIYGIEKGAIKYTPGGAVTLYRQAACAEDQELQVLESANLGDWNDETVSLKISIDSVVRICHDADYQRCEIFIGDGLCKDAANLGKPPGPGFPPGAADGISSLKSEGGKNVDLIVFKNVNCEDANSQAFFSEALCQRVTSFAGAGNSYWLRSNHQAIFCQEDWNNCAPEQGPPAGTTVCSSPPAPAAGNIRSICVYAPNGYCVGMFLIEGANRDFVPPLSGCKKLGATLGKKVTASEVGTGCKVSVYTDDFCTKDWEVLGSGSTSTNNVRSAGGL